jgi:GNAT superfamily N-acetyltransferase
MRVRPLEPKDEADWRRLWALYLAFYAVDLPAAVTQATWERLMRPGSGVLGLIAEQDGRVVGLAQAVIHANTWFPGDICYLEDMIVDEAARGQGIGHALISHLTEQCRANGWGRLYWMTRADNATARRLYDRFTPADDFVRYRIEVG